MECRDAPAVRTPEQREERMKQVPMHRYGTPEEVAQLVAFLLSLYDPKTMGFFG